MNRWTRAVLVLLLVPAWWWLQAHEPVAVYAEAGDEHPEVEETWQTCDDCHRDVTPEVVEAWAAGDHGLNNMKCFVCHGSTGADFAATPSTRACVSCHGDWVATMERDFMAGKDCFTCHEPHALSPHLTPGGE